MSNPDVSIQMIGGSFRVVDEAESVPVNPHRQRPATLADIKRIQAQAQAAKAAIPSWMTEADRHMRAIEGLDPVPWEAFENDVYRRAEAEEATMDGVYVRDNSPDICFA
jgi:hypothetical protein